MAQVRNQNGQGRGDLLLDCTRESMTTRKDEYLNIIIMKVFKAIKNGQVSYAKSLKEAIKTNPQVVFEQRGLIVPIR